MARIYRMEDKRPAQEGHRTQSLLALLDHVDLDDDQLDWVADLKVNEMLEIEPGLTITRES
jgi:hypothetical protein